MNLFTYGTLMCAEIMLEVAGCQPAHVPGTLRCYCRRSVKGEHYPAIMADGKSCVDGVVYLNLPDAAWERLDRFEGEMYVRTPVEIATSEHKILAAETYVIHPNFRDRLGDTEWDFAAFLKHGRASFQKHYQGYRALPKNR